MMHNKPYFDMSEPNNFALNGTWKRKDNTVIKVTVYLRVDNVFMYMFEEYGQSIFIDPEVFRREIELGQTKKHIT